MTPDTARHLARRLRLTREKRGLSAAEVARRAGVNVGTVTRIEQGLIANPRAENLVAIARVLNMRAADIFALANWIPTDDLPSFIPYMQAKYNVLLPPVALIELQHYIEAVATKYGAAGPQIGADE